MAFDAFLIRHLGSLVHCFCLGRLVHTTPDIESSQEQMQYLRFENHEKVFFVCWAARFDSLEGVSEWP